MRRVRQPMQRVLARHARCMSVIPSSGLRERLVEIKPQAGPDI